jgi:NADPH2:quinone reductase
MCPHSGNLESSYVILEPVRALVCRELGSIENLRIEEVADPTSGDKDLVIEVAAVGLSFLDLLIKFPLPFTPGGEFVGRVVEVGDEVRDFRVGDLVVGETVIGALAERIRVRTDQIFAIPEGIPIPVAATMLQSYSTALYALTRRTHLESGERVLVLGAGGGVGLACIDVATSLGAHAIAVASTQEKRVLATSMGADSVIDASNEDVKLRARELSAGSIDVVVDPIGGELSESALRTLGFDGRYLVVGFASGTIPSIPLNLVLLNNRKVIGVELGAETAHNPLVVRDVYLEVINGVSSGKFHPVRPRVTSLGGVVEALRALRDGESVGKIAIVIEPTARNP